MVGKIFVYKVICLFVVFLSLATKTFALSVDEVLKSRPEFRPAVVAISVKDLNTGEVLYQKNPRVLVHPASTLKFITSAAVYNYLGKDYKFKTAIYKNGDKIYVKVGADPLFSYADMLDLTSQYKAGNQDVVRKIYIDNTIIDDIPFGIGWQWDDNANIHFPMMSPYIVENNLFKVKISLKERNNILVEYANEYKEPIINNLKYGEKNKIFINRNLFAPDSPITLSGTINKTSIISIPAKNPKMLYENILLYSFLTNDVPVNMILKYDKVPRFSAQEAHIEHSIDDVMKIINQDSNNLAAETLLKHAATIKYEKTGTTKLGLNVVKDFYLANGLSMDNIIIVDASGVSMNDYVSADFMTNALKVISLSPEFNNIKNFMADNLVGTFKGRASNLNGKIKVKTGTLANTSSVIGYMKSSSNRDLAFAIILDNLPSKVNPKTLENQILQAISEF